MDKNTVLKLFISRGIQVDQNALDVLLKTPSLLDTVLKTDKTNLPTVITNTFLDTLQNQTTPTITVPQLSKIVMHRYNFLKNILIENTMLTNLISINKINEKLKEFSVIGIVDEVAEKLFLEDPTGQASFSISEELSRYIVEDEVIGVICHSSQGKMEVKNVVYPDIPLKRGSSQIKEKGNYVFVSDIHMDSPSFNNEIYQNFIKWAKIQDDITVFLHGGISSWQGDIDRILRDLKDVKTQFSANKIDPLIVKKGGLTILTGYTPFLKQYAEKWKVTIDSSIAKLLKKRNLNPIFQNNDYNNSYLLEDVPDIISLGGLDTPSATNYKGTTIITNGSFITEPIYWQINLQTRETFKINFA